MANTMEDEIIDLEEFSKAGKTPPKGKKYRIKIDRDVYVVKEECMTGRELLILAGKNPPEKFQINQKLKGGKVVKIKLDEQVCFTTPGIEKFMTLPLDQTEGSEERRQFDLLEEDVEYLQSLGLRWETLSLPNGFWVIIYAFPVPEGYTIIETNVAIKIEPGYPRSPLDMAYFHPPLYRKDGKTIGAISPEVIERVNFQRWSRHRTTQNPWREGVDNLSTHMCLVSYWFIQEFEKSPNGVPA